MKLEEILRNAERLGDDDVVYAMRPWTLQSEARVLQLSADETVPRELREDPSFKYYLESDLLTELDDSLRIPALFR
jgi:hypothetical protein